jgi:glycosyltransferase involved in cell wall biosynthesis
MRRPPLISFLTYNRLGNTVVSLYSLLRSHDDFELYIVDNGSKDATWEYLNDTKDPRIKHVRGFDTQIGCAHALNYMLTFRKDDQDWINFENDYNIHDKNFVNSFHEYYKEFPEIGAFSASVFPRQCQTIDELIKNDPERYIVRNEKRVYLDTVMGFCTYIPYETMNLIGYYDEVQCLLDIELQSRFKLLKRQTCYAMDIHVSHILKGGCCDTCVAHHSYCKGGNTCMEYYARIIPMVTQEIGLQGLSDINKLRIEENYPIKCNTIFSGHINPDEKKKSQDVIDLFKKLTRKYEEEVDKL